MSFSQDHSKACLRVLLLFAVAALSLSCSKVDSLDEKAFVVPEKLKLRSSTAQASRVVGELSSGDQVKVTGISRGEDGTPWSKVTGPNGEAGWGESKYFVKENVVIEARKLAEQVKDTQTQAVGKSKATLRLRLTPDRSTENNVATSLPAGTILEIVGRERKPKPAQAGAEEESDSSAQQKSETKYDEWYLVRLKNYVVLPAGWIYGGSVGLEIPSEILYYPSDGRRIMGWQKISTLHGDDGKTGDHYLVVERKNREANEQLDFDRIKILAYDPYSRNYSTPFRQDVSGRFPVTLNMQGTKGEFLINSIDKNNQVKTLTFRLEMLEGGKVKVIKPDQKAGD